MAFSLGFRLRVSQGYHATMKLPIYLDNNATTGPAVEVVEAIRRTLRDGWGNPGSAHAYGARTKQALALAREQVAKLIGARPTEIVFTSGGTESNHLAIIGAIEAMRAVDDLPPTLCTSVIEHPAVSGPVDRLASSVPGLQVLRLPTDTEGRVLADRLSAAEPDRPGLVSLMHAHNETGVLQPVRLLAEAAHALGLLMHTDAAQSVGKIPVGVDDLGVDLLSIAGHKFYGPQGVGALYVRSGTKIEPLFFGGGQERAHRPGTENIPAIVGLGVACSLAERELTDAALRMQGLRDLFESTLRSRFDQLVIHGQHAERLPNTSYLGLPGISARRVLSRLEGVAISSGSACHSDGSVASAALRAIGASSELAAGTLRISLGRSTTLAELEQATEEIATAIETEQV
jgi:cysteine desulfurase